MTRRRINLCGGVICVSQHLLHALQIRTVFYQMRRKGMPQTVRIHFLLYPCLLPIFADQLPHPLPTHGTAIAIHK